MVTKNLLKLFITEYQRKTSFTLGLIALLTCLGNAAVTQTKMDVISEHSAVSSSSDGEPHVVVDLSNATMLVSSSIMSPVRETIIQMIQEETNKRTQLRITEVGEWKGSTFIAIALSSDPFLYGQPVPETSKETSSTEGFQLIQTTNGGRKTLWLIAADNRGAVFAAGYLLRTASMSKKRIAFDTKYFCATAPEYPIRGHQLGYRTTANTYDAWTKAQYEQYIRELAIFGTNSIETIPFHENEKLVPFMKESPDEMNRFISDVCCRYDIDYWIWTPVEGDLSDPACYADEVKRHSDFYKNCPRIDGVFLPGGDPGNNHPKYVMPFLKDLASELKKYHPKGGIWLSLQGFSDEQVDYFYQYLLKEDPAWFTGVVSGPSSPSMTDTRARLPKKYKHRHYPDITHTLRCQYPTLNWDQAYALTLGREPVNPDPFYYAEIHNRFAPVTDGFLAYSDGSHDDLNKIVWSMCGWNTQSDVIEIVEQYVRFFFGAQPSDYVAEAVLGLTNNWNGPIERNGGIEMTFLRWQQLEKAYPRLQDNWRWQMFVLRAYYDTYIRRRKIYEQGLEQEANRILTQAPAIGAQKAMQLSLEKVNEADRINPSAALRKKIVTYCEALHQSIGYQTSVEKHGASGKERGCILDFIDYPLNNRWWLADQFKIISEMKTPEEQLAAIEIIHSWDHPGKGSFYDNISNISQSPHLVTKSLYDACDVAWWDDGMSRKRLSTQLFQKSPVLVYDGLDPNGRYTIRIAGEGDALLRVNGERIAPTVYNKELETFKEFLIDRRYIATGTLTVTFDIPEESNINWRRQSKICDIWLLKR